jgi:hypothetical protein
VLSVNSQHDFAEVLLVHTSPEMACEVDGIVMRHLSWAPYDLVVETDLRGAVWTQQLAAAVGHVDESVFDALSRIASGSEVDIGRSAEQAVHSGTHLAGPSDTRWAFKEAEGDSLRRISRDCSDALLDDSVTWLVDPRLLRPELLDLADNREVLIIELLDWVQTRALTLAPSDLDILIEMGVMESEAWTRLGDIGFDIWIGLEGLVERAATSSTDAGSMETTPVGLVTASHLGISAHVNEIEFVHYLGRKEAVLA